MRDTPRTDSMLASVIESDYPAIVAHDFANFARQLERELAKRPPEAEWRSPKDKPPHLPGEHHSEDVLIVMKDWNGKPACRIGHVSLGHWRPNGGNGNFDDNVLGWMPLPDPAAAMRQSATEGKDNG